MYRRFNLVLLGICAAGGVALLALAGWLEPVRGDLTRIGFYSENAHGWRGQERVFDPPLALEGRLDGQYDVVVLGDSFSQPLERTAAGGYWTDHFAAATGLRVGVFHVNTTGVEALLASPAMREAPPVLFVLELAERMLRGALDRPGPCVAPAPLPGVELPVAARPAVPVPRSRETRFELSGARIEYLFEYIRVNTQRVLTGRDGTKVRRLDVAGDGLFSSRRSDQLLAYAQDYDRAAWNGQAWARMRCRAGAIQAAVAAEGTTRFLLLVAPDKTTAYARQLAPSNRPVEAVPLLATVPGLALVRADLALRAAIEAGVRDVYLPNDTHWGSAGAEIMARAVIAAAAGSGKPAQQTGSAVASKAQ